MSQVGIDKIKAAMKLAADLRNTTADALADGQFQWQEAFAFIPSLMQIQGVVNSAAELVAQVKDADHDERQELEAYAKEVLNIPSENVEQFISDAVDWVITTIQLINSGKAL